jgi:hypothetical protein
MLGSLVSMERSGSRTVSAKLDPHTKQAAARSGFSASHIRHVHVIPLSVTLKPPPPIATSAAVEAAAEGGRGVAGGDARNEDGAVGAGGAGEPVVDARGSSPKRAWHCPHHCASRRFRPPHRGQRIVWGEGAEAVSTQSLSTQGAAASGAHPCYRTAVARSEGSRRPGRPTPPAYP